MSQEAAWTAALMFAGLLPLLGLLRSVRSRGVALGVMAVVALSSARALTSDGWRPTADTAKAPEQDCSRGYVSSDKCRSCHPREYATWHRSYHRTMSQLATPETVVGDFDDVELESYGRTIRLERRTDEHRADEYWVELDDPEWPAAKGPAPRVFRRIVLTTGSHHQQFYWHETTRGNALGLMGFVFRIAEQRWIPYEEVVVTPPPAHGAPRPPPLGAWNSGCIQCHATFGRPRIPREGPVETQVAELGIACEACHGPAEEHVAANQRPDHRYRSHLSADPDSTVVNPEHLSPRLSSYVCAQCHGVWMNFKPGHDAAKRASELNESGYAYRPGDDLQDTRSLMQPTAYGSPEVIQMVRRDRPNYFEHKWWSDGVLRVAGREFNSMIESPCYDQGETPGELSCLSCHAMHQPADDPRPIDEWADDQLGTGMRSNEACLQCHESYRDNIQEHTHHGADSTGSLCYNCHMSYSSYGLLKAIRSHVIENPSVQTSVKTGRPNACNQCHLDKTLEWTGKQLEKWHAIEPPHLDQIRRSVPASLLWLLRGDAGQRVLMAWSLGWGPAREVSGTDWMGRFLAVLLDDPYHAVRWVAYQSLQRLQGFQDFEFNTRAPAEERLAARNRALAQWRQLRTAAGLPDHARDLLSDPQHKLPENIFDVIFRKRNDRPVILLE